MGGLWWGRRRAGQRRLRPRQAARAWLRAPGLVAVIWPSPGGSLGLRRWRLACLAPRSVAVIERRIPTRGGPCARGADRARPAGCEGAGPGCAARTRLTLAQRTTAIHAVKMLNAVQLCVPDEADAGAATTVQAVQMLNARQLCVPDEADAGARQARIPLRPQQRQGRLQLQPPPPPQTPPTPTPPQTPPPPTTPLTRASRRIPPPPLQPTTPRPRRLSIPPPQHPAQFCEHPPPQKK